MNGVSKQYLVHQMVAIAFLGPYPEVRNMINHKDGNKRNSHIENLEYVTHSENCIHSRDVLGNNRQGEKCPTAKLSETQALDILSHWESGLHTYQEIAEKFNTSVPNVCNIVNKHTWTHLPTVTRDTNTPSPGAKLNEYIVKEIRKLHSEGKTYKSLSSIFHVDKSTIAHIIKRRTWKDVD
jgi:Mor family transcriptional regulator